MNNKQSFGNNIYNCTNTDSPNDKSNCLLERSISSCCDSLLFNTQNSVNKPSKSSFTLGSEFYADTATIELAKNPNEDSGFPYIIRVCVEKTSDNAKGNADYFMGSAQECRLKLNDKKTIVPKLSAKIKELSQGLQELD